MSPLNIRYFDEYIKYQRSPYSRNRPKNIIDHLLMGKGADDHAMIKLVKPINRTCYFVTSSDLILVLVINDVIAVAHVPILKTIV